VLHYNNTKNDNFFVIILKGTKGFMKWYLGGFAGTFNGIKGFPKARETLWRGLLTTASARDAGLAFALH
jgi:hypothetical protein